MTEEEAKILQAKADDLISEARKAGVPIVLLTFVEGKGVVASGTATPKAGIMMQTMGIQSCMNSMDLEVPQVEPSVN